MAEGGVRLRACGSPFFVRGGVGLCRGDAYVYRQANPQLAGRLRPLLFVACVRSSLPYAEHGRSSSGRRGPGSSHWRAASVAGITGIRSCTRIAALASVMITV
jgi:hypothetical protein